MKGKIERINLKILSIVGIILVIINFVTLFLTPSSGSEELDWFDTLFGLFFLGLLFYLLIFSIINLFRARKIASILGSALFFLVFLLFLIEVFRFYSRNKFTWLSIGQDLLFLFTIIFLGFFSIISFFKSLKEPAIEKSQLPETKLERFFKKVLWTIIAIFAGSFVGSIIQTSLDLYVHLAVPDYLSFYKNPPEWYFKLQGILTWIGFILCSTVIIFILYKKVGFLVTKIFSIIFLIIFLSFFIRTFLFEATLLNVPPDSGFTYIPDGTYALIDKISYKIREPKAGELVIYREEGTVKRVFAKVSSSGVHRVYPTPQEGIYTGNSHFVPKENIIGKLLVGKIIYLGAKPFSIYFFIISIPLTILTFTFTIFLSRYICKKLFKSSIVNK